MANDVVKVVQQAGLVGQDTVIELRRWGSPVIASSSGPDISADIVPLLIERAMQEQDFVQVRETDLEVLKQYLNTQDVGMLRLEDIRGNVDGVNIIFGKTAQGEYIIPWIDETVTDACINCLVSLHVPNSGWVTLRNPRELYYGERKMFTIWRADSQ